SRSAQALKASGHAADRVPAVAERQILVDDVRRGGVGDVPRPDVVDVELQRATLGGDGRAGVARALLLDHVDLEARAGDRDVEAAGLVDIGAQAPHRGIRLRLELLAKV